MPKRIFEIEWTDGDLQAMDVRDELVAAGDSFSVYTVKEIPDPREKEPVKTEEDHRVDELIAKHCDVSSEEEINLISGYGTNSELNAKAHLIPEIVEFLKNQIDHLMVHDNCFHEAKGLSEIIRMFRVEGKDLLEELKGGDAIGRKR